MNEPGLRGPNAEPGLRGPNAVAGLRGPNAEPGLPLFRSGFATILGRPNVGKSTLLNAMLGSKVSIVSDKPQTTRTQVRGVLDRPDAQVVFVDTPGIHKPRTPAGERFNAAATSAVDDDVDVVLLVIDATAPLGTGDRFVTRRVPAERGLCVVNKVDKASRAQVLGQLAAAAELGLAEYFPVSAVKGTGLDALVEAIVARMPEGPRYYPEGTVTDVPDAFWVAELVREQLLAVTREELPHSIACRVTEWEWPRIRCEILVERESQKGIVIGRGGEVLKKVGTAVRGQLPDGAFLDLVVRVEPDWQRRPHALDRLGF
ncbi:MAG TPA: GTPase Era [Acidimicrobiales bacterium]|nr:GTPase Era [Acidimicrobiales bacterium]